MTNRLPEEAAPRRRRGGGAEPAKAACRGRGRPEGRSGRLGPEESSAGGGRGGRAEGARRLPERGARGRRRAERAPAPAKERLALERQHCIALLHVHRVE